MPARPNTVAVAAFAVAVGLLCQPESAAAAPVITVRARTAIELEPIRRNYGAITVRGRVVDRLTREPVPYLRVHVRVDAYDRVAQSDGDGLFEVSFSITEDTHDLHVEFAGDRHHSASARAIPAFDVAKNPLTLAVYTDKVAAYAEGAFRVVVKAGSGAGGARLAVPLYAGTADSERLARAGTVQTDNNGRGVFSLTRAMLGAPGRKRVEARFPGNEAFDAASASATFLLATGSATSFELHRAEVSYESRVRGKGRVVDDLGNGIDKGPVALMVESRRLAETITEEDGSFELSVAASEVGPGKHNVQAVFEPTRSWRRESRSEPSAVSVAEPRPIPVSYTLAAFAATALAMLAFVALRTQPWKKWLARLRRTAGEEGEGREDEADREVPIHTGLAPARPSLVSTLRRAHDNGFTGVVRDAINGRPVAGAALTLSHTEHGIEVVETESGAGDPAREGYFAFERLGAGQWSASVQADGYVAEEFAVTLPHRGELRGVRIDLLSVRERIFSIYGDVAKPLLPDSRLWCVWTPRQIFDHVRALRLDAGTEAERPAPALASVTDFVEETYFSQRTPHESAIEEARAKIDAARVEAASFTPTLRE